MTETTVFTAAKIHTLDPARPGAAAVAVQDGLIVGVGAVDDLTSGGSTRIDDRFAGKIILPGFVEGHAHVTTGGNWQHVYVGYHDRLAPDGTVRKGARTLGEVIDRLRDAERSMPDDGRPLLAWAFDPIFFEGGRMTVADLDAVSRSRPIVINHQSAHALNVNSVVLERAGLGPSTEVDGIVVDDGGKATGELREAVVMHIAFHAVGADFQKDASSEIGIWNFGRLANLTGVTTITDLYLAQSTETAERYRRITADPQFPARVVAAIRGPRPAGPDLARMAEMLAYSHDKLRMGSIKLSVDGEIPTYTARLKQPHHDGTPNGVWTTHPEEARRQIRMYHKAGYQLHIHAVGDEASGLVLEFIAEALAAAPRPDHRHTIQHCPLMDEAQFRSARDLGVCVNLLSNHVHFYGDIHVERTLGPARAARMNALATAKRVGVNFAIHSDSPVTPLGPMLSIWSAVNRRTAKGRLLGPEERLSVADAVHAMTLGSAYTLKLDHEIGSIVPGKRADFAVLDQDPFAVDPIDLKDIAVHATVLGGRCFEARTRP
ncbi:MAG: amidohydrolase [Alphaproteobacteria bacterium]|nr:amidohydrolase [Alphaproteobacteria bacterium]